MLGFPVRLLSFIPSRNFLKFQTAVIEYKADVQKTQFSAWRHAANGQTRSFMEHDSNLIHAFLAGWLLSKLCYVKNHILIR